MSKLSRLGMALFVVGFLPHLVFAFFSPGLGSNGFWDVALCFWSIFTLMALFLGSLKRRSLWFFTVAQIILMGLVLFQTFSDATLYMGT